MSKNKASIPKLFPGMIVTVKGNGIWSLSSYVDWYREIVEKEIPLEIISECVDTLGQEYRVKPLKDCMHKGSFRIYEEEVDSIKSNGFVKF